MAEYCESPRDKPVCEGSSFVVVGTAGIKGDEAGGSGLWPAKEPKLALVGVIVSSRAIDGCWSCELGAVLGRGVKGFVSSPLRPWGFVTSVVFTGEKVVEAIVMVEVWIRLSEYI